MEKAGYAGVNVFPFANPTLSRRLETGQLTKEQYEAATGMNNPPPGTDPVEWRGGLMPFRTPQVR
jgi:hypothetical protein